METTIPLTDEQLDMLDVLMQEMTQGDYQWGKSTSRSRLGTAWWAVKAVLKGRGALHMVMDGAGEKAHIVAMTGNGPNASKNAEALTNLLAAWPYLLAEVKRGRARRHEPVGGWRHA